MPNYIVKDAITIRGKLTVNGNIIIVRRKDCYQLIEHLDAVPLSDHIGSDPIYYGNVTLDRNLIVLAYGRDTPSFSVGGSILAMGEIILK